jgi:hypothetical protein
VKLMHKGAVLAALAGGMVLASGGVASADAGATGAAFGSPGVLSGNVFQMPVNIPINACGNSLNLLALLNPTFGNSCANVSVHSVTTQPFRSMDDGRNNGHGAWHHEGEEKDPAKGEKKDPGKKDPEKNEKKDPGKKDPAKKDPAKGEKKDPGKKDPEKNGKKDPGKKDSENHFHHEVHHVKTHHDCK